MPFDLLFLKTAEAETVIITLLLSRDKEKRRGDGAISCNICNICSFSIITLMGEFLRNICGTCQKINQVMQPKTFYMGLFRTIYGSVPRLGESAEPA